MQTKKVMVVDDEKDLVSKFRDFFSSREGFEFVAPTVVRVDLSDLLAAISREPPDVLFLDWQISIRFTGYDVYKAVSEELKLKTVSISEQLADPEYFFGYKRHPEAIFKAKLKLFIEKCELFQ